MIDSIKEWATCATCHVNGWMLKFLFAGAFTLLGYATEQATGLEVGQPAAYMFCGAYLFDTPHDLIFTPGDPWYDHVMDTVVPCGTALGLSYMIERSKAELVLPPVLPPQLADSLPASPRSCVMLHFPPEGG